MNKNEKPKPDVPTIKVVIGFSEGLNFGCGFFVAGGLFFIVAVPVTVFILTVLGLSLS